MKAKSKRRPLGVKWKMLCYLSLFIAVLLILLWFFQTVFLDSFYKMVKIRSIKTAADSIVRQLDSGDLSELAAAVALREEVCVLALDESYQKLASAEASRACVIHSASTYALYQMVSAAEENGGSATLFRDESIMYPQNPFPGGQLPGQQPDDMGQPAASQSGRPEDGSGERKLGGARMGKPQSMVYVRLVDKADGSRIILLLDTMITPVDATVSTLRIQLIYITLLLALLAVGLAFLISRRISRPIIRLRDAAAQLAAGNYDVSFPAGGYREIDELGDTLRYAAGELATVEQLRRELIANVSHDLRTPLTMIIGYSEAMRDIPGENTPENVQIIIEEAKRLTDLVGDMLDLSRLQSGTAALSPRPYNLTGSLEELTGRLARLTEKEGFSVRLEADRQVYVHADENRIAQVLYNLICNALNHAGPDKAVLVRQTVENTPQGERVLVEVCDRGPGIPAEELPRIFDRYYKLDRGHAKAHVKSGAESSPLSGTGLGLSIVRSVLELHGAAYGVVSAPGQGSRFWFRLPALPPQIPDKER